MKKESKRKIQIVSWVFFIIYLVMMVYFLFFSEQMGRIPGNRYRYNLIPFTEIRRYLNYRNKIGGFHVMLNLLGNVVCFIPFGFVIPILTRKQTALRMFLLSMAASILVELLQLVSMLGSCDVDDIFLNTLGGIIGYCLFIIGRGIVRRYMRKHRKGDR
ncbi:MAG: VanZ family protein [Lachnospiraceae bacterium]|nr:VanZ family protein [Lachnospiraceae bacterium]